MKLRSGLPLIVLPFLLRRSREPMILQFPSLGIQLFSLSGCRLSAVPFMLSNIILY